MLIECSNCGFYLKPNEKFCPDCGLNDPQSPLPPVDVQIENRVLLKVVGIIGGAALIGLILYRLNGGSVDFGDWFRLAFLILFIGTVAAIIAVFLNARRVVSTSEQERFPNAENGASLQYIYDTCLLRNHELTEKSGALRGSVKRGIRGTTEGIKPEQRKPKEQIFRLLGDYDLFLNRIILARLQNDLLPLANGESNMSDADFFDELNILSTEIKNLSAGVETDFSDKSSESLMNEKQNFLIAAGKTEELCAALINRRKETGQFGLAFAAPEAEDSMNQIEILNSRRTLAEISLSFKELEREYGKLKI